ncbi:MAG: protein translocase subunit SecF [Acidimicrobiales bacterium]|nr:protein translocase subunit SecF [Acidimicrobiales bacterium]MCB1015687.1 protein translocase subunit SecF [Acidimicrobiales bacterium]MCB9371285.1 protein translocase subunit SecF [Microthrixaceae bacterium]
MSGIARLYRGDNDYDFRKLWRIALPLSAVLVVISVVSLFTRGLNLGIDFEGGGVWEVPSQDFSIGDARDAMGSVGEADAKITTLTNSSGDQIVRIQAGAESVTRSGEITETLADAAGVQPDEISVSTVGPSWGDNITDKAVRALVMFFVIMAIYIALTLEWRMAVGALVAVAHDIVISVGVYSLFQLEVTPATVVAFLTILGFSLYDTIVVFDKVKENQARVGLANRTTYTGLMNLSLNQTLMRSVNTTVVTVVPVLSILLIGAVLLGAVTLEEFGFALLIGLVSGAYSSIVVASSLVAALKEREPRNRQLRERLERSYDGAVPVTGIRHATPAAMRPAATAAASVGGSPASSSGASRGPGVDRPAGGTAIPPRPRKKKRR